MRHLNPITRLLLSIFLLSIPFATPHTLPVPTPPVSIRNPHFDPNSDTTFPEPTPAPAQKLSPDPSCALLSRAISICAVLTPGFVILLPSAQARCLCYSSTSWAPKVLDNAVKTCADFASTAAPGVYDPLRNLEGFCESVGDVGSGGGTPALALASTTPVSGGSSGAGTTSVSMSMSNYVMPGAATSVPLYIGGQSSSGPSSGSGYGSVSITVSEVSGESGGNGNNGAGATSGSGSGNGNGNGNGGSPIFTLNIGSGSSSSGVSMSSSAGMSVSSTSSTHTSTTTSFTVTVNPTGATKTGDGAVRNRGEVTGGTVVLISMAIAMLLVFL
ncbi:hypothetical protein BUE80_DR012978 [Diplocarpon rosae]|nr:hypothetical protein BUE80_DR012978 [Diplocarpon rosae]